MNYSLFYECGRNLEDLRDKWKQMEAKNIEAVAMPVRR